MSRSGAAEFEATAALSARRRHSAGNSIQASGQRALRGLVELVGQLGTGKRCALSRRSRERRPRRSHRILLAAGRVPAARHMRYIAEGPLRRTWSSRRLHLQQPKFPVTGILASTFRRSPEDSDNSDVHRHDLHRADGSLAAAARWYGEARSRSGERAQSTLGLI